uniref:Uncharacterized protein n=1 Tax=Anguilla anguilla TaxID=7936 RepID=A0A0E9QL24_ANGAN
MHGGRVCALYVWCPLETCGHLVSTSPCGNIFPFISIHACYHILSSL